MGSTRPFDAFTFFFKERAEGIFIAHCYQYEPNASTWVLEMEPETFRRAGLEQATEAESARFMENVFAEELAGHSLVTNRSHWRQFPMIRCARWTQGNVVLLGDAKATAHFSIGSGTKLAMEDAIALHAALPAAPATGRRRPARGSRTAAARRSRKSSTRPTSRWCGSSMCGASGHAPDPVRVRPHDPLESDHLRQPRTARAGFRPRGRHAVRAEADAGRQASDGRHRIPPIPAPPMFQPFRLRAHGAARTGSWCLPMCQVQRRRRHARPTGTWCTTAPARPAAPA